MPAIPRPPRLRLIMFVLVANIATTTTLVGGCHQGSVSTQALKDTLGVGLTNQLNQVSVPEGAITIMSGLSSQMEAQDPRAKRYSQASYSYFQLLARNGLLTLVEQPQSSLDAMGRMGAVTVISTPTAKAREIAAKDQTRPGFLVFATAKCEVLSVVLDTAYTAPDLLASEEYRLVLGTYRCTPTAFQIAISSSAKPAEYRFKALLHLDRFSKTYRYVRADWGVIGQDEWSTRLIR